MSKRPQMPIQATQDDVHTFTSHFWNKVCDKKGKYQFATVKRWTKSLGDLSKYRVILFPVYSPGHWSLIVVRFRTRRIEWMDSMGNDGAFYTNTVWKYLQDDECQTTGKSVDDIPDWNIVTVRNCPQQNNGNDCGVFVCCYALCVTFDLPLIKTTSPFSGVIWSYPLTEGFFATL